MSVDFAVFVKPWKRLSLAELGPHIRKLGFDLIELPVRPGFACEPEHIAALGRPTTEAMIVARVIQPGRSSSGTTIDAAWIANHATRQYTTATR
jgi:hypothetical protein